MSGFILAVFLCLLHFHVVWSWNEWKYTVQWNEDPTKVDSSFQQWHDTWDLENYIGDDSPPRARRGHSLHLIKTDTGFPEYGGDTYIVLFGGRDNDQKAIHIPKTYDVEKVR